MLKHKSVDAYIENSAKEGQPVMKALRTLIKATLPEVEEGISWGVPFYKYHGPLAGFAVYKKHVSFGVATGTIEKADREMLSAKGYVNGIRTVQIDFEKKIPAAFIKKILKIKAGINEAKKQKPKP